MFKNLKNIKMSYAGHIMINTSGHYDTLLTTIKGRLRRIWVDVLRNWTEIKRSAGRRNLHGTFATQAVDATLNALKANF